MNYSMIRYILAWVFTFEGMFLMLPAIVGGIYGEKQGLFTVERVSINTVDDGECMVIQLVFPGIEDLW